MVLWPTNVSAWAEHPTQGLCDSGCGLRRAFSVSPRLCILGDGNKYESASSGGVTSFQGWEKEKDNEEAHPAG
jgi:hypothetical protein